MNTILDQINTACQLVDKYQGNQLDKAGVPYKNHLLSVHDRVVADGHIKRIANDPVLNYNYEYARIVAILHNIVEDTEVTLDYLKQLGFSNEVIDAIDSITHRNNEDYYDFIIRVSKNQIASLVKIHDLKDNMDITRLNKWDKKAGERCRKYWYSWQYLEGNISASQLNDAIGSNQDLINETKDIIASSRKLSAEVDSMNEGLAFLIKEYKNNKRYFRDSPGRVTIEDIIKTAYEFGWSSRHNFDEQQK